MNRPAMLVEALRQLFVTTQGHDLEVICIIDEDVESLKQVQGRFGQVKIGFNLQRVGTIKAWNQALRMSHGDMLFPFSDDQWPHPQWLDIALAAHRDVLGGYGVVALNDLMHDGSLVTGTTTMYDRRFVIEQMGGLVAWPCYHSGCIDMEVNERARRVGHYVWCKESIVEHRHSANGKREFDDHDRYTVQFTEEDNAMFLKRKAENFPDLWPPAITS